MQKRSFLRCAAASVLALATGHVLAKNDAGLEALGTSMPDGVPCEPEPPVFESVGKEFTLHAMLHELVIHLEPVVQGELVDLATGDRVRDLADRARTEHPRFEDKTIPIQLTVHDAVDESFEAGQRKIFAGHAVNLCGSLLQDLGV